MNLTKVLLDMDNFNLFLQNLGNVYADILTPIINLFYGEQNLTYASVKRALNVLGIWPTAEDYANAAFDVYYVTHTLFSNSYTQAVQQLYRINPTWYAFDCLHMYYLKSWYYQIIVSSYVKLHLSVNKPLVISLSFDCIFANSFNKWSFFFGLLGIVFYLTHLMKFRLQYGFNFFFNYFKMIADVGEQDCGAYDDFQFFLFLLVYMLVWYCWVLFVGYNWGPKAASALNLITISIMCIILFIPTILLWNFGLAFGMYIRGAASSANLIVEAFFDMIGVIIVYTRFIVQNIRFLLVFVAYFELFEWIATSPETNLFVDTITLSDLFEDGSAISFESICYFILVVFKVFTVYVYHLLHLIIVSFMQIGVYFMVSFWLFFFLYTSFIKVSLDSYFSKKR